MMKHARLLAAAAATAVAVAAAAPAAAHTGPPTSPQVALDWNRTAVATLLASGKPGTEALIYLALTQAAVYDAVTAIEGGFRPYRIRPGVRRKPRRRRRPRPRPRRTAC